MRRRRISMPWLSICRSGEARECSSLGNADEAQARHITIPVERLFNGIHLPEPLDSEVRFEREELANIRLGFVESTKVTKRCDQRLVAVNEIGVGLDRAAPDEDGSLIIALKGIGDRVEALEVRNIKLWRGQFAVSF